MTSAVGDPHAAGAPRAWVDRAPRDLAGIAAEAARGDGRTEIEQRSLLRALQLAQAMRLADEAAPRDAFGRERVQARVPRSADPGPPSSSRIPSYTARSAAEKQQKIAVATLVSLSSDRITSVTAMRVARSTGNP